MGSTIRMSRWQSWQGALARDPSTRVCAIRRIEKRRGNDPLPADKMERLRRGLPDFKHQILGQNLRFSSLPPLLRGIKARCVPRQKGKTISP